MVKKRPALLKLNLLGNVSSGLEHRSYIPEETKADLPLAAELDNVYISQVVLVSKVSKVVDRN